jgi:hypothetical protein
MDADCLDFIETDYLPLVKSHLDDGMYGNRCAALDRWQGHLRQWESIRTGCNAGWSLHFRESGSLLVFFPLRSHLRGSLG